MADTITETETETELDFPALWGVRFLNDDFTPMDYVMGILVYMFGETEQSAYEIMMKVHNNGEAVVGQFTKDIAETKAEHATQHAENCGHPLRMTPVAL